MATTAFVGNLVNEIELKTTTQGKSFANVTVAVNEKRRNRQTGEFEDGPTWFARGTLWGEMAENVHASVGKGSRVIASGKIVQRDWEDQNGNKRSSVEIEFDGFGPDLRFATAQVTRRQRQDAQNGFGGQNPTGGGFGSPSVPGLVNNDGFGGGFDSDQPF